MLDTPAAVATTDGTPATETALDELRAREREHPFWQNRFLKACRDGVLTLDDLRVFFGEYYHYSQSFTRYLAGLMANCEDDYWRARISENLWEEGGGTEPEKRHAELFRRFLREGLGIADPSAIAHAEFTRHFVRQIVDFCLASDACATSAFLSLGTEGLVKRTYELFVKALLRAGVDERHLEFFHLHIECDDDHAVTIEEMMRSYAGRPGWKERCLAGMEQALALRERFFESAFDLIQLRRLRGIVARIQDGRSLLRERKLGAPLRACCETDGDFLYENVHERLEIDFEVRRLPFEGEVLDPRVVRIAPSKNNELHRHAHESLLYVVRGEGRVRIDSEEVPVKAGDVAFVPRWAYHQTRNTGERELVLLAITDYGLTGRAFVGSYDRTARMAPAAGSLVTQRADPDADPGSKASGEPG